MIDSDAAGCSGEPSVSRLPALPVTESDRPWVRDLRGSELDQGLTLRWPAGHRLVVSGLPGSGKSTLMRRAASGVHRIDSQDVRERWARRLPRWIPYVVYRPLVRLCHYGALWYTLRSPASVIVHDCGRASWVRRWLARHSRSRGLGLHLLLLDVAAPVALAGQWERGRTVSQRTFERHRRAMAALLARIEGGRLPPGCASVTLLDAESAARLRRITFAPANPDDERGA